MAAKAAKGRFAGQTRVALAGSERQPFDFTGNVAATAEAGAGQASPRTSSKTFSVSVLLRPKEPLAEAGSVRISRAEFARRHGPDPASVKVVTAFASEFGLSVEVTKPAGRRTVLLSGTQAALQSAFGVQLQQVSGFRVREGAIMIPEELAGHVTAVLGLDNRPQARTHFRVASPKVTNVQYTPVQVAELYGFPTNVSAKGQTIGLIELGGGYKSADITAYFKSLGQTPPQVTAVSVDKAKNKPTTANGADGEVLLDIEVAAAVAPGAAVAVYFAPNTDQGFVDAVTTAVHDTTHKPAVISISWGGPEPSWTSQAITALDQACAAAAALGVTITVAAGDNGSTDGVTGGGNAVDFPASSPHVLACGGTKLEGSGTRITSEVVWNELTANEGATGGGVSSVFALPSWQAKAGVPKPSGPNGGRGVPDVAGDADPATGYTIRVDGQTSVIGGTSAVAPLWAGLITLANAANKQSAGFVNPQLYAAKSGTFRDITSGSNGAFQARPGWDACTGLGSPVGANVVAALKGATTTKKPSNTASDTQNDDEATDRSRAAKKV